MSKARLNHVSVVARRLEESVAFYEKLFGAEALPTPNFGFPVQWMRLGGGLQLHLFERGEKAPSHHHFAIAVEDITPVYRAAREAGSLDSVTFGHHLYELPSGQLQLYMRDPAGNLVEVNADDASRLGAEAAGELRRLSDGRPQDEVNRSAVLFLD
ncbi:MAG: VOC family protein [Candidatus Dormibacterales bacterium]